MAGSVRKLAAQGWGGLQWAEGLPGTIGGAVFGNAGCYGGDVATVLARAWLLIGDAIEEWPVERFAYGYRTSVLKRTTDDRRPTTKRLIKYLRWSVVMSSVVEPNRPRGRVQHPAHRPARAGGADGAHRRRAQGQDALGIILRQRVQDPPRASAGRLLEAAGLKGTRVGGAEIAQKHANYIVNLGGASSADVLG